MEYLFLRRRETICTSQRQKDLLFKAAEKHWKEEIVMRGRNNKEIDCLIYKKLLYQLEIRMAFLDSELSLTKLSAMIDTNQTYLSNVVNRYFECNLKGLLNRYRIEYAKELLQTGYSTLENLPNKCGFASKSPFYTAFKKVTGITPIQYMTRFRQRN